MVSRISAMDMVTRIHRVLCRRKCTAVHVDSSDRARDIHRMEFTVTVAHDENEGVWYVESSDIPGLHVEAPTFDALLEVITDAALDLIAANVPKAVFEDGVAIPLRVEHLGNSRRST